MPRGAMSEEHKAALAEGRRQGRDVRDYLQALEHGKRRGRRLSRQELENRVDGLRDRIAGEPDPAKRLELVQQRLDYEDRLAAETDEPDMESLETAFVAAARPYSERKGITWTAWRELGVPAATLKKAGVPRTRRTSAG